MADAPFDLSNPTSVRPPDARPLTAAEPAGYLANPSRAYFRLPREMMDDTHPLSPARSGEPASRREALADLVAYAEWKDATGGLRGEALAGTRWLAGRWRWHRSRVRRFLEELEATGTIEWTRGTQRGEPSRVTIVGYDHLQNRPKSQVTVTRESEPVTYPPSRPTPVTHLPARSGATNPEGVTHLVDPPSRTGNRPLPKVEEPPPSEETLVVRTHAREGEAEAEGEGEALPWDVVDEKKKETQPEAYGNKLARPPSVALESEMEPHAKEHTGNRCEECGRPIGPTAKLCAACRFPDTRKSAEWADARSEELAP